MTNSSDNSRKEHRALRLTAVVLVVAVAVLIVIAILCRTCSVEASAKADVDFERIAELVELKDGVLSERRHREQKASEEGTVEADKAVAEGLQEVDTVCESVECTEEAEIRDDIPLCVETVRTETAYSQYRFNQGEGVIPTEILYELRARLIAHNIEWWLPVAEAQMFQESHCNYLAENRNGLDKGLFQYRVTYWSAMCVEHGLPAETSIFDWRAQINIYVQDAARRLRSGCSVEETISRHMTSDYCPAINTKYVNDVLQWAR